MKKITKLVLFCFLTCNVNQAPAQLFGPSSYEECILESMKGVTSDRAANFIERACREKFPKKKAPNNKASPNPKPVRKRFDSRVNFSIEDTRVRSTVRKVDFVDFPDVYPNNNSYADKKAPRFMNRNNFDVVGVKIGVVGVTVGNSCPNKLESYKFLINCGGLIRANSSAMVQCDKWDGDFCVVAITTAKYFTYEDEVLKFVDGIR